MKSGEYLGVEITGMAREIFPSSYQCDCGNESHFFENTIREMKKMSVKKRVRLCDEQNHTIIFDQGRATEILCPNKGKCPILEVK